MPVEFRPAVRRGFGLFIVLVGTSTTGKTVSALRLARGLAGPKGRIAVIDTEGGRTSHYATEYPFDELRMGAPFHPWLFSEAARDAQEAGYGALIIDNFSLEWMGEGGVLDMHEAELTRRYGQDERKRRASSQAVWGVVKPPHKRMMTDLLQLTIPIIFCIRAEEKTKPGPDGKPIPLGWKPIQDARFVYEWTVSLMLHPDTPGKPRYDLGAGTFKVQDQHRSFFPEGEFISEEAGRKLREWAGIVGGEGDGATAAAAPAPAATAGAGKAKRDITPKQFVDQQIEIIGTLDANGIRAHMASPKIKPWVERLTDAAPAEYERLATFADQRIDLLEQASNEIKQGVEDGSTAKTNGEIAFVDSLVEQISNMNRIRDIDALLQKNADKVERLISENPEEAARLTAAAEAGRKAAKYP